jgi:hypothetical protein
MCDTHPVPDPVGGGPNQRAVAMWDLEDWMLAGWLQQRCVRRAVSASVVSLYKSTMRCNPTACLCFV